MKPCPYTMVIQWSDEDGVYVVTLPEFGGCRTHGETYEKAARSGREVLELLMQSAKEEGQSLPAPATLQAAEDGWKALQLSSPAAAQTTE
jgi:predicted RNase H-like HicB family nuclease